MSSENPYQSPQEDSRRSPDLTEGAGVRRYPTWKFWLLVVTVFPGLATLSHVLKMAHDKQRQSGPSPDELVFGFVFVFAIATFLGAFATIFVLWRLPSDHRAIPMYRPLAWCCLTAIVALEVEAFLSVMISAIALTHMLYEGKVYFAARDDVPYFIGLFIGPICGAFTIPLGVWLVSDFLGKDLFGNPRR